MIFNQGTYALLASRSLFVASGVFGVVPAASGVDGERAVLSTTRGLLEIALAAEADASLGSAVVEVAVSLSVPAPTVAVSSGLSSFFIIARTRLCSQERKKDNQHFVVNTKSQPTNSLHPLTLFWPPAHFLMPKVFLKLAQPMEWMWWLSSQQL